MRVGRISLYTSGLSDEERALTGGETVVDLDETIARSIALADPCVAVIPEGPYVVPYFRAG
jgi:lactate racemase